MRAGHDRPRSALVTGAAGGIGQAIVDWFLEAGINVLAVDLATEGLAARFPSACADDRLVRFDGDLTESGNRLRIVDECISRFGRVDILVNNAARIIRTEISATSEDEWDLLMAINLKASYFLSKLCAARMCRHGWGRIINLTSQAGQTGGAADCPIYAITKGGVNTMTRSFARAYAANGITVNAVAPGIVMTDMIEKTLPGDKIASLTAQIPIGRVTDASEIAATVGFLSSDEARSITGHVLDINGGMLMR